MTNLVWRATVINHVTSYHTLLGNQLEYIEHVHELYNRTDCIIDWKSNEFFCCLELWEICKNYVSVTKLTLVVYVQLSLICSFVSLYSSLSNIILYTEFFTDKKSCISQAAYMNIYILCSIYSQNLYWLSVLYFVEPFDLMHISRGIWCCSNRKTML